MNEFYRLIWGGLIGFFRSRASLEAEILVLRHQLNVLRRKSPKRPTFGSTDRLIFAGLYGLAPNVLSALAIVRPETRQLLQSHPNAPVVEQGLASFARRRVIRPHITCANSGRIAPPIRQDLVSDRDTGHWIARQR
jgi:hypothetical protein